MLDFFVRRPITTLMFVIFFVVLGVVSFPKMNIERTPSVDFPMVTATFIYPGASPSEIESQVVKKAEDAMSEVAGLKKITSSVFENGGFVMAEFNLGVNVNDKATEVKAKLDSLSTEFPDALKQPVVEKLNPLQSSVIDIVLQGANPRDMEEYVDDILSNKITAIKGVANVSVFGGQKRAVRIYMNPELMAAHGVSVIDIVSALGSNNLNVPGGKIEAGTDSLNVRFIGEFGSIDDIKNFRITTPEGDNFALKDIADVNDAARDIENGALYNGENSVILSVIKATDGNAIKISKELHNKLPDYQRDLSARFPGAQITVISDSSIAIADETNGTIEGIILGVVFTVLILMVFTKNWRSTVIAAVVIPASLIAGFFFMQLSGFTINTMTLLAYSSALGTLVSNAIILIESALSEMRAGKDANTAAVDGTRKVMVPILAGVGTNVVVFLPIAFMGGIAGQFMSQFGMTVVYVTLLSLLFSFTLTPMMIGQFLKLSDKKEKKSEAKNKVKKEEMPRMRKWYDFQEKHPWKVVGMAVLVFLASAMLMKFVGNEFAPSTDSGKIVVTVRAPAGSTYLKSESIAKQIGEELKQFPDVKSTSVKIGERGLQNITVNIELVDASKRKLSDKKIAGQMLPVLSQIPDAEIQIKAGESMSGGASSSDMVLNIIGEDDSKRAAYAASALKIINNMPEIASAVLAQQEPGMEYKFIPDYKKMNLWGVNNAYAGSSLRAALFGNDDYKYKEDGKEYPMIVEFAKPFKNQAMFENVYVNSKKGLVPLSDLGRIEFVRATPNISRLDKNRITEININIGKSTIGPVQKQIESKLSKLDWEFGYSAQFGGMSEIQAETTSEIAGAFLLATILTFMLLAGILNSMAHPLTIATSIITSFAGVFIVMFLTGAAINVAAMLAFVMLVGLVVNNNILILEPAINRISAGESASSALWAEIVDKKAMILMTSIAVIAGMLPQLWSPDGMKSAMGAVMVGGMTASLIFTFVLTPSIFFLMERARNKIRHKNE